MQLILKFQALKKILQPHICIIIFDKEQRPVASLELNKKTDLTVSSDGYFEFKVTHKKITAI